MLRKLFMMFLILTLGLSPVATVWAGNMSSSGIDEMSMNAGHDHSAMQQVDQQTVDQQANNNKAATHCQIKCNSDCDSGCCASGVCDTCGHCAAALINLSVAVLANQPYISPLTDIYTLESREFTPPFRPPLLTS